MKNIIKSIIISIIVNIMLFGINLMCAYSFEMLPLAISFPGGECIEHIGFGVSLLEVFSLSSVTDKTNHSNIISVNIPSLIVSIIAIFLITLFIIYISEKYKNRLSKKSK